jgi:DNA topoisomerase-1
MGAFRGKRCSGTILSLFHQTLSMLAAPAISKQKTKQLFKDINGSAKAMQLVYVNDNQEGISRKKSGKIFSYYKGGKKVSGEDAHRIKTLVIPPAWEKVWICPRADGHLQATGLDAAGRKQYKYHPLWTSFRNHSKFYHLLEFGKALPAIRQQLEKDLGLTGMPLDKVLATVVSLMEQTGIRIGSSIYEKLYGSFGLTTLKNKHVQIKGHSLKFMFKGKKGIQQNIELKSKKLASIIHKCRDIPGQELFQYYSEDGNTQSIDSGMVNSYIKRISAGDFSAKDFRTWAGSVQALLAFKTLGGFETAGEAKAKTVEALDMVATALGNTRAVCKKYYVHPVIISLYEAGKLDKYLKGIGSKTKTLIGGLNKEEKSLMKLLDWDMKKGKLTVE